MIASVFLCTNGMVVVFDEHGQQLSAYQGRMKDCLSQLLDGAPENTEWYWVCFQEWTQSVSHSQVRCFYKMNFENGEPHERPQTDRAPPLSPL